MPLKIFANNEKAKNIGQEILDMFTMADKDEDGKINYEEFLIMITPRKVASLDQIILTLTHHCGPPGPPNLPKT